MLALWISLNLILLAESYAYGYGNGYYSAPSPFGIPQGQPQVWSQQQRVYGPRYGYNSVQAYGGYSGGTFSRGNIAHQRAQYYADLRLFQEAVYYIRKANLNQSDIEGVVAAAQAWNVDGVKDEIYNLVNTKFDPMDRNRTLQLLDLLAPPRSFTDALEALTIEQKSHISELFKIYRYQDLSVIVNGLIKSLPDANQPQARRFVQALHYILQQFPRGFN